ncbi:hypothetical protein K0U27_01745 [archaeon]|nr:hypothetical protein [archaeon]
MHYPVLIYDNLCTSCTNFARIINYVFGGKITMIGHYTAQGKEFKESIFPENYDGTEMSWFVTEKKAYGGRKALQHLIKYTFSIKHGEYTKNTFDLRECTTECNTVKGVMFRSYSVLSNSKIIECHS